VGSLKDSVNQFLESNRSGDEDRQEGRKKEDDADIRRVNIAMLFTLTISTLVLVGIGWRSNGTGPLLMWAIASIATGAAAGFLFGIPRVSRLEAGAQTPVSRSTASTPPTGQQALRTDSGRGTPNGALRPNTNLEEVSDWLTKILVGLGLVHIQELRGFIMGTAENAASAIPTATHISIASALIVGFAIEGFFGGYIYTRLFLQGAFARSDNQLIDIARSDIEQVLANAPDEPPATGDQAGIPSLAQVKAAKAVEKIASINPQAAIEKMKELALEYEQLRSSMPSSQERTRKMIDVVGRMTVVCLGAESHLRQFSISSSPGDRLAAVVILKMRFNPAYSNWLAARLLEDPPFVGFQAARALLAGARLLGGPQLEELKAAVADGYSALKEKGWDNDSSRDKLIMQILEVGTHAPGGKE
jgi:hypothetical protein